MHAHSEVCATEQRLPTKDSPGGSWIVACYRRPWNQGWIGYLYQTNSDRLHRTFHQECPQVNLEGTVWYSCFKLVLLNVDMGSNWMKICGKRAEVLHYVGTNMAAASLEPTFIQVLQVYGQLAEALYEIHVWTSWSSGNELMELPDWKATSLPKDHPPASLKSPLHRPPNPVQHLQYVYK